MKEKSPGTSALRQKLTSSSRQRGASAKWQKQTLAAVDAATRRAEEAGQKHQGEEFVPEEPVVLPDLNVGSRQVAPLSMDTIRPVSDCRVDPLRFLLIYGKASGGRMG